MSRASGDASGRVAAARVTSAVAGYHGVVLTVWYLAVAALVAERFWDYWSTLLT